MSSKDSILNRIRQVSSGKKLFDVEEPDWNKNELVSIDEDLSAEFKKQIEKVSGVFYKLSSYKELVEKVKSHLSEEEIADVTCSSETLASQTGLSYKSTADNDDAFIVPCEALIASTGSVLVSSKSGGNRRNHVFPPVLFVVAYSSQLVPFIKDGLDAIKMKHEALPSMISLITGPSRTADIEKTLVLGAHGPKKLIVFLLPDNEMISNHSKQA
ncbi:lactate utilization protein C [Saccharicrinis sp. FJH62]|uniref:LutC/YkgG family protein n=1 Tax=Saccharicrinis sp. FJH62 TaxID=3344657 RepID=UPI0035D499DF